MANLYQQHPIAGVIRLADGAAIPPDTKNSDWNVYLAYVAGGGLTDPVDPAYAAALMQMVQQTADAAAVKADALIAALANATPAQVANFIATHATDCPPNTLMLLQKFGLVLCILARRL